MKPEELFSEEESSQSLEENPLFAPDEVAPVKPSTETGFKMWWDGWD